MPSVPLFGGAKAIHFVAFVPRLELATASDMGLLKLETLSLGGEIYTAYGVAHDAIVMLAGFVIRE